MDIELIPGESLTQSKPLDNIPLREEKQYSFEAPTGQRLVRQISEKSQSNNLHAGFTLLRYFIGATLLTLPFSTNLIGIIPASCCIIFIAILTYYCMSLLVAVADESNENQLENLAYTLLGKWGMYSVELSIFLRQFGTSTVSLLFGAKFLNHMIIFCLIVVVPLSMVNKIRYFFIPSMISHGLSFAGLATQIFYDTKLIGEKSISQDSLKDFLLTFRPESIPEFLGIAVYMFETVSMYFSIRASMKTPYDLFPIFKYQLICLTIFYVFFTVICNIALGQSIPTIVILSLPANGFYIWMVGLYALVVFLGFPLRLYPLIHVLESLEYFQTRMFDPKQKTKNGLLRYGIRIVIILLMLIVVHTAKSINLLLSFMGSLVSTYLAFILPTILFNKHFGSRISRTRINLNIMVSCIGILMGILGVLESLADMFGWRKYDMDASKSGSFNNI